MLRLNLGGMLLVALQFLGLDFHQAKIENLHLAAIRQKNVRRLDIAVHDAFGVCGFQRVGHLRGDGQQLVHREGDAAQHMGKGLALEKFHDQKILTVDHLNGVNGANVGMIQGGSGARFTLEAFG